MRHDDPILELLVTEIQRKRAPMETIWSAHSVFSMAGLIQLALRHPEMLDVPREVGERFLAGAREYFADCPGVLEVLRRGEDPSEDR